MSDLDLTEQQVDKFFESGGELDLLEDNSSTDEEPIKVEREEVKEEAPVEQKEVKKERMVPYDSLHEERMKRQELAKKLNEGEQKISTLEQNFQRVLSTLNKAKEEAAPRFEDDPIEFLKHKNQLLEEKISKLSERDEKFEQTNKQNSSYQNFINKYREDANQYAENVPDFMEAYKFAQAERIKEYKELGYNTSQANQMLLEDELMIANKAYEDGVNPAERLYKYAKFKGYQGKQTKNDNSNLSKLQKMERSVNENISLSNVQGKVSKPEMTLEEISHLDDDQLEEFISNDKNWQKLSKIMK